MNTTSAIVIFLSMTMIIELHVSAYPSEVNYAVLATHGSSKDLRKINPITHGSKDAAVHTQEGGIQSMKYYYCII